MDISTIVVFANKKDFCLTKICIASIRYYYPEIEILLVKDKLNGDFNTHRMCRTLNVKVLDIGQKYFGWGAAKIHFILNQSLPKKRYLCLDSDIIFVGRFLGKIASIPHAFVVNPDWQSPPFDEAVTALYIDIDKVKKYYPDYVYPGYFFNTGQFIATPGIINEAFFLASFDPSQYPFYKNRDAFSLVDQAVLNTVLPVFSNSTGIDTGTLHFMHWSVSFFKDAKNQTFETFKDGKTEYLVHYAGDLRTHKIKEMKGSDLLLNFHKQYFSRLSLVSKILDSLQDEFASNKFIIQFYYKVNRVMIELNKYRVKKHKNVAQR